MTPIADGHAGMRAEVVHACRREMAMTLEDVLVRRTHARYEARGNARDEAASLAALAGDELGWTPERRDAETAHYRALTAAAWT